MRFSAFIFACSLTTACTSNDLSSPEHARTWANTASALGVYSNVYEVVATADGEHEFADPACPAVEDDAGGVQALQVPATQGKPLLGEENGGQKGQQ